MNKLTKDVAKRFDEKFLDGVWGRYAANLTDKAKQHLADELERQEKELSVKWDRYLEKHVIPDIRARQKKEMVEKLENMVIETAGNSAKTLHQAIKTL